MKIDSLNFEIPDNFVGEGGGFARLVNYVFQTERHRPFHTIVSVTWELCPGQLTQGFGYKSEQAFEFALAHPELENLIPIYVDESAFEPKEASYLGNGLRSNNKDQLFASFVSEIGGTTSPNYFTLVDLREEIKTTLSDQEVDLSKVSVEELNESCRYVFDTVDWQRISSFVCETDWTADYAYAISKE